MGFDFYAFYEMLASTGAKIRLDAGDPNHPVPKPVLQALRERMASSLGYTPASGIMELRERIAEIHGVGVDEVIVTPGAKAAIAALVKPAHSIGVVAPYWPGYRVITGYFDRRLHAIHASRRRGWIPAPQKIGELARKSDTIILNYPNNPTGTTLSVDEAREILEVCRDAGRIVVSDEAYRDLAFNGSRLVLAELESEGVVSIYSFSKTFSMPGLRIGYAVGDPTLIKRIREFISATYTGVPAYSQYAALKALELLEEASTMARRTYYTRLLAATRELNDVLFDYVMPKGGLYLFLRLKNGVDGTLLSYRLAEKGVGVFPGEAFGGERYRDHIRISLTSPLPMIIEGLRIIESEAENLGGR